MLRGSCRADPGKQAEAEAAGSRWLIRQRRLTPPTHRRTAVPLNPQTGYSRPPVRRWCQSPLPWQTLHWCPTPVPVCSTTRDRKDFQIGALLGFIETLL